VIDQWRGCDVTATTHHPSQSDSVVLIVIGRSIVLSRAACDVRRRDRRTCSKLTSVASWSNFADDICDSDMPWRESKNRLSSDFGIRFKLEVPLIFSYTRIPLQHEDASWHRCSGYHPFSRLDRKNSRLVTDSGPLHMHMRYICIAR